MGGKKICYIDEKDVLCAREEYTTAHTSEGIY